MESISDAVFPSARERAMFETLRASNAIRSKQRKPRLPGPGTRAESRGVGHAADPATSGRLSVVFPFFGVGSRRREALRPPARPTKTGRHLRKERQNVSRRAVGIKRPSLKRPDRDQRTPVARNREKRAQSRFSREKPASVVVKTLNPSPCPEFKEPYCFSPESRNLLTMRKRREKTCFGYAFSLSGRVNPCRQFRLRAARGDSLHKKTSHPR